MNEIEALKLLLKAEKDDDYDDDEEDNQPTLFDLDDDDDETDSKKMKGKGKVKPSDDEDDDEYDPRYIKKFLKKYAQDNEEEFKKFCKDIGVLKKAVSDAAAEADIDGADAVLVEGTEMFKAFANFADSVSETLTEMQKKINLISEVALGQAALLRENSKVVVKAATTIARFENEPGMFKAVTYSPEVRQSQQQQMTIGKIKSVLLKAAQNGDERALTAMTKVESCYGNIAAVGEDTINYIKRLMEAN